jgi:hypothetical protein
MCHTHPDHTFPPVVYHPGGYPRPLTSHTASGAYRRADALAAAGFVGAQHLGRLKIGMSSSFKTLEPAALLASAPALAELLHLTPIGEGELRRVTTPS